jgi:alkylation response protein AidB-like acyl-CoA dehydrogenase
VAEHEVSYVRTEEQDLIASTARQYLEENIDIGRVRELMMSEDGFDRALWKEMAGLGWMGLTIADAHGGAGLGFPDVGVLLEEMGRLVTPGPFFASAVLATTAIQEMATESQCADLLPALASGEKIASLAVYESPRGWDVSTPATTATRSGDGWVLNGHKRSVLDGHMADELIVTAMTDDGVGVFILAVDAGGVGVTQEPVLDPTRRQATVTLDSVSVGPKARLGDDDAGEGLRRTLRLAAVALASEQVGGAQRCMEMSVEYAKSRYQFGRPIGSYQAIKHRCANMLMRVEHAKSTAYYAARVTDDDTELAVAAPLASSVASEAYVWVAGENIQVHGGIGFTWEHDAHIYLKRAKSSALLSGGSRHQRDQLGQAIGI